MRKIALAAALLVVTAGVSGLAWRAEAASPKIFAFTGVFTGGQEPTPVSTSAPRVNSVCRLCSIR